MPLHKISAVVLVALIKAYGFAISPLLGANKCRFYPTCSCYMATSVERHGAAKGLVLGIKRLLKCHPWYKGAIEDPVPTSIAWRDIIGYKPDRKKTCGKDA